jgi:hypothetical protein
MCNLKKENGRFLTRKSMCYEQADYAAEMEAQAAGEAEAAAGYEEYLQQLLNDGQHYLWALEIMQDMFSSTDFKRSGLSAEEYISKKKAKFLEPQKIERKFDLEPLGTCAWCKKPCEPDKAECKECGELPF